MVLSRIYPSLKPFIPRRMQIFLRQQWARVIRHRTVNTWPIDEKAAEQPPGWPGWPNGKRFALVLTHDVDTAQGQQQCQQLASIEKELGFRSCFLFVPERYAVSEKLRHYLIDNGFEVGVHDLRHDGRLFASREEFQRRARKVNTYLSQWKAVGFRAACMYHNLDWIGDLDVEYDCSTFDTDPFEPQPDGAGTVFPFWVPRRGCGYRGYVEMPYTLAQDWTLFILLREKNTDLWKKKLDWIYEKGGMALVIVHPDYLCFDHSLPRYDKYPVDYYIEFLRYVKEKYRDEYWHALPADMAHFWAEHHSAAAYHMPGLTTLRPELQHVLAEENFRLSEVPWCLYKKLLKLLAKGMPGYPIRRQLLRMAGYGIGAHTFIGQDFMIVDELADRHRVSIGERVAIAPRVTLVVSSQPQVSRILPFVRTAHGYIEIGDDAWLGAGCIILPNVRIGRGAVVGAGAVVTKDVPDYTVVAGVPARVLKKLSVPKDMMQPV